jgi:hypothetical protein
MSIVGTPQYVFSFGTGAPGSPRSLTITPPTNGNSLLVVINNGGASGTRALTANAGAVTFELDYTSTNSGAHEFYRANNIATGPSSIEYSWDGGGSAFVEAWVFEVQNLAASPLQDTNAEQHFLAESGDVTLDSSTANAIAIAAMFLFDSRDVTASGPNVARVGSGSTTQDCLYSTDLGAAGSKNIGGTWTGTVQAHFAGVVYEIAAAAPPAGATVAWFVA